MKKSKETLKQSLRLIIIVLLIIYFLESNILEPVRVFVASFFPFFHGKRAVFSNIFIGILGSAVLLAFGELLNYIHEKHRLEYEILKLYQKWDKEIKHKDELIINNIPVLHSIDSQIINFCKEVSLIYNDYLPYIRAGLYFNLIRSMFQYANEINEYWNKIEYIKNEKPYLINRINYYKDLKLVCSDSEIIKAIDTCIESLKNQLATMELDKIDEKSTIKEIFEKRNAILANSAIADVFLIRYKDESIEKKDEKTEFKIKMNKTHKSIKQIKSQRLKDSLKKLSPKNLWQEIKIKRLIRKYKDKR